MSEHDELAKRLRNQALIATRDESAEAIEALQEEVERLKYALTEFRNFARDALPKSPALDARIDLASKALEAKP